MSGSNLIEAQQNIGYEEKIEFLVTATGEVKQISKAIGDELDEHKILLDDVSESMDKVHERLEKYNKQMQALVHSKEGPLTLIAVILTLVLIFLVVWVIL